MERRTKKEESVSTDPGYSIVDDIRELAAKNARAPLNSEKQLLLFLQSWWSQTYNRPLKDPILQSYTFEELLYEFFDRIERSNARKEQLELEDVKIEEAKEKAVLDWAELEELKEMQAEAAKSEQDPTKASDNVKWMEEQIEKAKEDFGESFGEDIDETFD